MLETLRSCQPSVTFLLSASSKVSVSSGSSCAKLSENE